VTLRLILGRPAVLAATRVFATLTVAVVALAGLGSAQSASLQEIGIQGYLTKDNSPTRVRVRVTNPGAQATALKLSISVGEKDARLGRVDQFSASVALQAGEDRLLDLPIPFFAARPVLTLTATTPDGRVVLSQSRALERINANSLVLLLCSDDKTCNEVLGTIQASGSDELKTRKTQRYTFLVLKELPEEWWAYAPAHSVILARPAAGLSAAERAALEGYCRQSGQLALVEPLVGPGILDAYRTGTSTEPRTGVGSGGLFRFHDAAELASFFDRSVSDLMTETAKNFGEFERSRWIRFSALNSPLSTMFDFPTLPWLIIWLVIYIVIVGAVNFYVLTKLNRRELAWITVPGIALAFALVLYVSSAAKRPDRPGLDEIATYHLDDLSPEAAANYQLRVSSPTRQDLSVRVPGNAVWSGTDQVLTPTASFSVFDRSAANSGEGWSIRLLPQREFVVPLLQWSYQDLNLAGLVTLPGSLKTLPNGQLINETGFSFRQAVLRDGDRVYDLGAVAAGATFSPRNGMGEEIKQLLGPSYTIVAEAGRFDRNSHEDIKRLLITGANASKPVFAGLAEMSSLGASLGTHDYARRQYVIVVITLRGGA